MTNLNTIDFIRFVGPTETLTDGGKVLEVSGFAGSGDVVGPASAVDEQIAVYDGTTGKLIKDGGYTIADLIAMMGGGTTNTGTTTIDFGAFPGASDASVTVTGQTGILSGSIVQAWLIPVATADHTADEHMVETIKVVAGNIAAGTGFTIYAFNTNTLNEPDREPRRSRFSGTGQDAGPGQFKQTIEGGRGTRIYGQWTVAWTWS